MLSTVNIEGWGMDTIYKRHISLENEQMCGYFSMVLYTFACKLQELVPFLVTYLPHPSEIMLLHYLLALGCVFVWGCTFISSKILLQAGLTPVDILLLRFGLAYGMLLPFYRKHLVLPSWKDEAWMAFLGITGGSLYFLTENSAIKYTLTTNASLIVSLTPLYTMLLMRVLNRKTTRLSSRMLLGSLLAVIGVFSVVMNGHILLELNPLGDFLSLASGLCWSFYSLAYCRVAEKWSALLITRKLFFWGFITALPFAFLQDSSVDFSIIAGQPVVWGNLLFLGVVASLLCFFGWNVAVSRIGAIHANNLIYFNPLITLLVAHQVLGEPLTWMSVSGMLLTILGVWVANGKR